MFRGTDGISRFEAGRATTRHPAFNNANDKELASVAPVLVMWRLALTLLCVEYDWRLLLRGSPRLSHLGPASTMLPSPMPTRATTRVRVSRTRVERSTEWWVRRSARSNGFVTGRGPRVSMGEKKSHVGRCPTLSHYVPDQNP